MKKIFGVLLGLGILALTAGPVRASEGQAVLQATTADGPHCLTNSVFIDNSYHLLLTCRNLITPYSAEVTRYVLWYFDDERERWVSLGRVDQGKLYARASAKFSQLQVTAEATNSPRTPSESVVVSGQVVPFDFDKATTPKISATPTPSLAVTIVPSPTPQGSVIGGVVRTVAKFLVIGFVVLLIGVVVLTLVTRRKDL